MNAKADNWETNFASAMGYLRASYPTQRFDEPQWRSMLGVWSRMLRKYPVPVLARSVQLVTRQHPDRFPTLPQFEQACASAAKSYTPEGRPLPRLPATTQGREAYILEGGSPFEQLARLWETEDAGKPQTMPTPQDAGALRFRQLWSTWGKHEAWVAKRAEKGSEP